MMALLFHRNRWMLLLVFGLVPSTSSQAQIPDCADTLGAAEEAYVWGRFNEAVESVTQCLDLKDLPPTQHRQALRLICVTYLAQNQHQPAKRYAHLLLKIAPDYTPDPHADPPRFREMIQTLKENTETTEGQGRMLLEKAWSALGGTEVLQQLQTVQQSGHMTLKPRNANPEPFTVFFRLPNQMRIEIGTPTGPYVQLLNKDQARIRMPGRAPQRHPLAEMQANLWLEPLYLMARADEAHPAHLGTEVVEGITCEVLELFPPGATSRRVYIDTASGRIVKISVSTQDGLLLSDYRSVGDILVPFRRVSTRNNRPIAEIQYTEVQLNIALDEALFRQP